MVDPAEVEVLEDLIVAAFNDARAKVNAHAEAEMQKLTGGLQLARRHEAAVLTGLSLTASGPLRATPPRAAGESGACSLPSRRDERAPPSQRWRAATGPRSRAMSELDTLIQLLGAAAGARAALGAARGAVSAEAARAGDGAAWRRRLPPRRRRSGRARPAAISIPPIPCAICRDPKRDPAAICVVEDLADLWALERTGAFRGRYHVLGGTLSALDGIGPEELNIARLIARLGPEHRADPGAQRHGRGPDDGALHRRPRRRHRRPDLAPRAGVPIGGELDYLDEGTLTAALKARRAL